MAKKILNYDDSANNVIIGTLEEDSPDDYEVRTFGGDDTITFYVDGVVDIYAGDGNDSIVANGSGTGNVYGMSGNDDISHNENTFDNGVLLIDGGDGDDIIGGLDGAYDTIKGGAGNDFIVLNDKNTGYGGSGDDTYVLSDGTTTVIELAGEGYDIVQAGFPMGSYTFGANIEEFRDETYLDVAITGNNQANKVRTGTGNDKFHMKNGNDYVEAGDGNDTIYGEIGNDTVDLR